MTDQQRARCVEELLEEINALRERFPERLMWQHAWDDTTGITADIWGLRTMTSWWDGRPVVDVVKTL